MPSNILLKAVGLNTQPNQLDLPPGSLTQASNVIIKRDNVIESRRGYKLYGDSMGSSSDRAKQLMTYKDRILRHFSNQLEFDTGTFDSQGQAIFQPFCGSYLEPETGRRIRFIESNSNFYFTTSEGIKKISAKTASDLTTACPYITQAGGIKALDVTARLNVVLGSQTGFLPQDSAVAYRVVWGSRDLNNNLILGAPSQRAEVYNPLGNLILQDFMRLLEALDNVSDSTPVSLISDGNYVDTLKLPITSSATEVRTNLIALTDKLDTDILYADQVVVAPLQISTAVISTGVCTITFSSGDPTDYLISGSQILLAGFTPATGTLNGPQTVSTVTTTTLTFNTTATGAVTTLTATINSYEYGFLTQPTIPSTPATDQELVEIQTYLQEIITRLQSEPDTGTPPVITTASQTNFISVLDITTTATVFLDITIPQDVTTSNFYQVYRSDIAQATGVSVLTDIFPNDELRLVYEAYPTSADITAGTITIEDITPDAFRGANLYTNQTTGEGILQANDLPPFALDINRFKNVLFYANTRTRQRKTLNLLGVANMVADYNGGTTPTITISDGTTTNTYTFVTGQIEVTDITTVADVAGSLNNTYFTLNSANDYHMYYIWFNVSGTGTDPMIPNLTGLEVNINTGDSANTVASKLANAITVINANFNATALTNVVTVSNTEYGYTTDAADFSTGFGFSITTQGRGENAATNEILLSTLVSPAQAVDQTARSMVHVINSNASELTYAFYLSGAQDVPGRMLLEDRSLSDNPFYIVANNSVTGLSFNPDLSPEGTFTSIAVGNPTVITTSAPHGLINLDQIIITNSDSTPSVNGLHVITYISTTTFSINVNVTIAGTQGSFRNSNTAIVSDNEALKNRIYYSKYLQPEAVPLVNTIDVGAKDKAILRIFPLRDSLFVYKEDGLFRISGETSPFNLSLFDSSCILLAPDSLDVSNNLIYGWTTQGIYSTSESGVTNISRAIDIDILKLATAQYVNFKSATWGIGYESDNSYTVYTVQKQTDIYAQIGFRYSTLTNSWTTFDKSDTCGVINSVDDRQYLGAGDTNFLEQERKNFDRQDYADRETIQQLIVGNYFGIQLKLANVSELGVGDVVTQEQLVTVYDFNALLKKLDTDVTLSPHDYFSTQESFAGDDFRINLDDLLTKIAADPGRISQPGFTPAADYLAYQSITGLGSITNISAGDPTIITSVGHGLQTGRIISISGSNSSPSIDGTYAVNVLTANTFSIAAIVTVVGTTGSYSVENEDFRDINASYNGMIGLLNNDTGVAYSNYVEINHSTLQEAIILAVNKVTKKITLNHKLDFISGPLVFYQTITSVVTWSPQTMGDALSFKQFREATLIFEDKAFTNAILSFATDLLPAYTPVPFTGTSNGIFGFNDFGFNFFGGASHAAPFRTYIPRNAQRCRFLTCQFMHTGAREKFSIFGLSLTGEIYSVRAYR